MVKIEQLSPGAVVSFERDGNRQRAFLHQLLTREELNTLVVERGSVTYSIDESEVLSASAPEPVPEPVAVAAPEPAAAPAKPKIVYPSKTAKKK